MLLPLPSVPGITFGEIRHLFEFASQPFQSNVQELLSWQSHSVGALALSLASLPWLSVGRELGEQRSSHLCPYLGVGGVFVHPSHCFWSVSFVEKVRHVDTVKVNFPQAFFWEFSQLLWFSKGYSPTLDIQGRLVDPLYDETETSTVLGDFSE